MTVERWRKFFWAYAGRMHEHLECCPSCVKGEFCERVKIIWRGMENFNKGCFKETGKTIDMGLDKWFPFAVVQKLEGLKRG